MKTTILRTAILALGTSLTMAACSKSDTTVPANSNNPNTPNVPAGNTVKLTDIQDRYFVIQKTVGKPLAVIYFVNDNGLQFYYDANGSRRTGTPVLTNLDSTSGNATLTIDLDNNGVDVFELSLSKAAVGGLALTQTKYHNNVSEIMAANMYRTADLVVSDYKNLYLNLAYTEGSPAVNYTDTYSFTTDICSYRKYKLGNNTPLTSWDKSYYALPNGVGFKVADPGVMGVQFKNSAGRYFMLIDNGSGTVREVEII